MHKEFFSFLANILDFLFLNQTFKGFNLLNDNRCLSLTIFKVVGLVHPGWRCKLTSEHKTTKVNVWAVHTIQRNLSFTIQEMEGIIENALREFLKKQDEVIDYYIVPHTLISSKYVIAVWDSQRYITKDLLELRCFPIEPITVQRGIAKWVIALEEPKNLFSLIESLTKKNGYKLAYVKTLKDINLETVLTNRQYLVLKKALKEGYYEYPRKISLSTLANQVGISPSTLTKILRNAEKRIFQKIMK